MDVRREHGEQQTQHAERNRDEAESATAAITAKRSGTQSERKRGTNKLNDEYNAQQRALCRRDSIR